MNRKGRRKREREGEGERGNTETRKEVGWVMKG